MICQTPEVHFWFYIFQKHTGLGARMKKAFQTVLLVSSFPIHSFHKYVLSACLPAILQMRTLELQSQQLTSWLTLGKSLHSSDSHFFIHKMRIIEWLSGLLWGFAENLAWSGDSIKQQVRTAQPESSFTVLIQDVYLDDSLPLQMGGSVFVVTGIVNASGIWGRGQGCLNPAMGTTVLHSKTQGRTVCNPPDFQMSHQVTRHQYNQ